MPQALCNFWFHWVSYSGKTLAVHWIASRIFGSPFRSGVELTSCSRKKGLKKMHRGTSFQILQRHMASSIESLTLLPHSFLNPDLLILAPEIDV